MNKTSELHKPVMEAEVVEWVGNAKRVIDATLGFGGHAQALLMAGCDVLGIDMDEETLKLAESKIVSAKLDKKFKAVNGNFTNLYEIAKKVGFDAVDAILFDLGINSYQLDQSGRGISFKALDEDLDMRLNKGMSVKASDLLAALDKHNLTRLFGEVLSKGLANQLAVAIVERKKMETNLPAGRQVIKVSDLVTLCEQTFGAWSPKLLPKVFLALRMAVNGEIENLQEALPRAFELLRQGGRLVVITFHSTEDRVVKNIFNDLTKTNKAINLTGVGIKPTDSEIKENPRSRSARMRVIEKI